MRALLLALLAIPMVGCVDTTDIEIDRSEYHDRLRGFWLAHRKYAVAATGDVLAREQSHVGHD